MIHDGSTIILTDYTTIKKHRMFAIRGLITN